MERLRSLHRRPLFCCAIAGWIGIASAAFVPGCQPGAKTQPRTDAALTQSVEALTAPPSTQCAIDDPPLDQSLYPALPILSPTALTADAGDGRVYLRWNLQDEDPRVIGWNVVQLKPELRTLNEKPLVAPSFVARDLINDQACTFAIVGVLKDGSLTPQSNAVTIMPRATGTAKIDPIQATTQFSVGPVNDVTINQPNAAKVTFPDGQELIYTNFRPIDWKTRDGQHLIYPKPFGNGVDIGKFDDGGIAKSIPPTGMDISKVPTPGKDIAHDPAQFIDPNYRDAQYGQPHPYITDPLTLSIAGDNHDAYATWYTPEIDGDRVTFRYLMPIRAMNYRSWTYVVVWETWWPIERDRHGTQYHGLARLVQVEMPEVLKDGYQVMLNNGFGPNAGSRDGVISYSAGFRNPSHELVDFSGDKNRQVFFQNPKPPRRGSFHPNQDSLQSSPLIFYDWGKGSLTIGARSLYYHCANNSSSYIEQGADGVWPNLAWDLGRSGQRMDVDTVEYLYAPDVSQPLPQRYLNAHYEAVSDLSHRMGVQDRSFGAAEDQHLGELGRTPGGVEAYARNYVEKLKGQGIDSFGAAFHDTWLSNPYIVEQNYVVDPNYGINPRIKAMCDILHEAGMSVGYWHRPEFVKTSIVNVLSKHLPDMERFYHSHGVNEAQWPNAVPRIKAVGLKLVREHPEWIRRRIDGSWPYNTPYQWVPMSLATPWWDRVMWPTLVTSRKLGFSWMLLDGGFGGLNGVDYAPRLMGLTDSAVPCQPYWWRFFRSMEHVGLGLMGECTVGWRGGRTYLAADGDQHYSWLFNGGYMYGTGPFSDAREAHRLLQLYTAIRNGVGDAPVRLYGIEFFRNNRPPDWIELKDLHALDPVEMTVPVPDSPTTGSGTRVTEQPTMKIKVTPWAWGDAIWHYDDGTQVVYPSYDHVDWNAVKATTQPAAP